MNLTLSDTIRMKTFIVESLIYWKIKSLFGVKNFVSPSLKFGYKIGMVAKEEMSRALWIRKRQDDMFSVGERIGNGREELPISKFVLYSLLDWYGFG
jgi:hypothetical protein